MEQLLLVNPSRSGKRRKRLPPRGPGGRFLKRGSKRRTSSRKRRRNPIPGTAVMAANPVRKYRRRARPARVSRRRRRNPIGGGFIGALTAPLMPAFIGAGGAVLNDVAYKFLPLPANLKTGMLGTVSRAVVAVGLGMALDKVVGRKTAAQLTAGALTVLAYGQVRGILSNVAPNLLSEYISDADEMGYYGAGTALNEIPDSLRDIPNSLSDEFSLGGVGEYISGSDDY